MPHATVARVARRSLPGRLARMGLFTVVVGAIACAARPAFCGGGLTPITWGTPTTISGASDVSTSGSLVYAYNFGSSTLLSGSTATVNGVPFLPFAVSDFSSSQTVGDLTIAESPAWLRSNVNLSSGSSNFSTLPSSYQFLLQSGVFADSPATVTISLGGLTTSQDYIVQWWSCDATYSFLFDTTTAVSSSGTVSLLTNVSNAQGGLGQYVIGSFTAGGSTANFELQTPIGPLNGASFPLINAIQVRAVPEPSGYALALVGCGAAYGLIARRKRHRTTSPTAAPRGATSPR